MDPRKQILLTNDDGIDSPGLWMAAEALSQLGYVWLAAPRDQASSTGRSLPITSDGRIVRKELQIGEQVWPVYAIGGTPAQVVLHMIHEVMPVRPDLVVSGINYGENVGMSITISGTVGAAMEGAAHGIPSLAVSQQVDPSHYFTHSNEIDFATAAYFTAFFARQLLEKPMPEDVDLLKIDVPTGATPATPWEITRLTRERYYHSTFNRVGGLEDECRVTARLVYDLETLIPKTDLHALIKEQKVSVTPISLDMTSRVEAELLERLLEE